MRQRMFYIGLAILAATVVYAFTLVGSPAYNRGLAEDRQTVRFLSCVACSAQRQYCENGKLPADKKMLMEEMERKKQKWCGDYRCNNNIPSDPEQAIAYDYEVRGKEIYALCATLKNDSKAQDMEMRKSDRVAEFADYQAGRHCFLLKAKPPEAKKPCH